MWEDAMTAYRLLWRDENGNALKSMQIECSSDRQAIEIAEHQTGDYAEIEIWDGPRPVGRCGNPNRSKKS
jgi:hypothetical protein